ncbi:MAG: hypothetical protein QOF72_587, partial [Blastocatellia bacterium]|nr:hypothetical protein [Blastocatellia bacterium]
ISRTPSDKEMSEMPLVRFENVVLRFDDVTVFKYDTREDMDHGYGKVRQRRRHDY